MNHPVLIILMRKNCYFCELLIKSWDNIIQSLLSVYPQLRFPISTIDTKQYQYPPIYVHNDTINYNLFPKDLSNYILWYPFVMLIPGDSWDECNLNLGINNTAKFKNVQIMNCKQDDNGINRAYNQYDMRLYKKYPEYFIHWLKDALKKINFLKTNTFLKPINNIDNTNYLNIISR